jgi:hypothetical protein
VGFVTEEAALKKTFSEKRKNYEPGFSAYPYNTG